MAPSDKNEDPDEPRRDITRLIEDGHRIVASKDDIREQRLMEVAKSLFLPESLSDDVRMARIASAWERYEDLNPVDGLESMLAIQMVATHEAIGECVRRAAIENQTFEGRDLALKHAEKLMALYLKQVAALDKHRGKGQQKVTVEHVTVNEGGQAIVGHVEGSRRGQSKEIDNAQSVPDAVNPETASQTKRKTRTS